MDQVAFLHSCSLLCLAVALAASCFTCLSGNRPNSGTSAVVVTSCLLSCSVMWSFPYYVVFGITVATVGISLSSLHSSLQSLFHQKEATTMPAATLLWKVVCAMLKRGELGQAIVCLIWGVHCFITHVLLELEDLVLDLAPQWQGEVFVILGHPRSASTHVHHMLSQTLPSSASLSFYDVLFPSLIQWYCMQPFKPLVDIFLSLLDSPQHRIAVDEVAEEQQWLLLKFKDILLPMLFPAMVDDPELFRASCDYTEADMMFIKGCMRRLLIRKPQSKLYIARMLTFSPWPEYVTTAFPDAKFIVCLRETEECLRSFVSLAAVHSGGNPNTPLCKKWAQNCADTLTKGTVRGLQRLVDGQVPAESVMQVNFKSWKAETRASLIWLLKELGMHEELKAVEGSEEVKVERREQHKSSPDVTDCLEGYAGILCADLGWVPDRNEAGYLAGWLQSSNVFGRMLSSSIWGYVAARHGFDVVLVVTLTSLLVGGLLFGFCKSLVLAMLVRFMFFGLTHGWVAIMGPYCASVAGDKRQQDVIGIVIAVGTGMQLVGPAVSGWTYGLVPSFPALVPSLLGALLALVSISLYSLLHCRASTGKSSEPSEQTERASAREETTTSRRSMRRTLRRWPIPLVIFMRFCQGFAQFAIFEVAPLWMISDRAVGGLQMSEKQVGVLLARSGLWNIVYFSLVLPTLTTRLGGRCTSIIVSVFGTIFSALLPFCASELTANVAHLLATSALLSQAAMLLVFTNNAVGAADRAIVSGLAVTIDTTGKAIAPIATSTLFAWSINAWGLAGHGLVFYILAGLSLVNLLCTALLPASVENDPGPPVPRGGAGTESSEGTIYGASESNESSDSADSDARC